MVADEKTQVSIQWFGHSCFYIHSPGGTAVVTDPFVPAATGLAPPGTRGHLVTISTQSPEHNAAASVEAFRADTKQVVHGTEARRGDLKVVPVATSGPGGARNFIYLIEAGAMRIVHLGDLRGPLTPEQIKALGSVDILLTPVGAPPGTPGPSPKAMVAIAKQINPRLVIPMAYSTSTMEGHAAKLRPVDDFVSASPYARTDKDADVVLLSRAELPASTEIWVLRYGH